MAKKPVAEDNPEITLKGDIITISSITPISAETVQQWNLRPSDTVSLKFVLELDAKKLAKFIEKQGAPPKGASWSDWASKLAKALAKQGLMEAATEGVDIQLTQ